LKFTFSDWADLDIGEFGWEPYENWDKDWKWGEQLLQVAWVARVSMNAVNEILRF
jgi:hypothetical protein